MGVGVSVTGAVDGISIQATEHTGSLEDIHLKLFKACQKSTRVRCELALCCRLKDCEDVLLVSEASDSGKLGENRMRTACRGAWNNTRASSLKTCPTVQVSQPGLSRSFGRIRRVKVVLFNIVPVGRSM